MIGFLRRALALMGACMLATTASAVTPLTYEFEFHGSGVTTIQPYGQLPTFTQFEVAVVKFFIADASDPNPNRHITVPGPADLYAATSGLYFRLDEIVRVSAGGNGNVCFSNPAGTLPLGNVTIDSGCGTLDYTYYNSGQRFSQTFTGVATRLTIYASDPAQTVNGYSFTAVPEPASWAMMLLGFGAVGFTARRRFRYSTVAA